MLSFVASGEHEHLLSIGAFALLSRLSIPALRHYGETGLLPPAGTDPRTGYRRYSRDQLAAARTIRVLRAVDVPLEDIAGALEANTEESVRDALIAHRERLALRAAQLTQMLTHTEELLKRGIYMPSATARVSEVSLIVDDVSSVAQFYRDVFDVEFGRDQHDGPEHYHASFGDWPGSDFFMLTIWPAEGPSSVSHLGFVVDDLDATWTLAREAGAQLLTPPHDSEAMPRNAKFLDPAGNHVMIYEG